MQLFPIDIHTYSWVQTSSAWATVVNPRPFVDQQIGLIDLDHTFNQKTGCYKIYHTSTMVFRDIFCCDRTSAQILSIIAAVYGVIVYSAAFAIEMWFIIAYASAIADHQVDSHWKSTSSSSSSSSLGATNHAHHNNHHPFAGIESDEESGTTVPIIAFILALIYFIVIIASLILILGLIIHSLMCILIWLVTMLLIVLPESAIVVYVSLYKWVSQLTNERG